MSEWITVNPARKREPDEDWVTVTPVQEPEPVKEQAVGSRPYGAPMLQDFKDLVTEGAPATLRGVLTALEGLANLTAIPAEGPEARAARGVSAEQTQALELPKPAAPLTDVGKAVEFAAEFITPAIPVAKVAKGAKAAVKAAFTKPPAPAQNIAAEALKAAEQIPIIRPIPAPPPGSVPATGIAPWGQAPRPARPARQPRGAPIQASEQATRTAETIQPEDILRPRDVARPAKAQGQSARRLSMEDDLAQVRANILDAGGGFKEARRSGTTVAETLERGKKLGMTDEDLLSRPIGTAYNAEQIGRAEQMANDSALRMKLYAQASINGDDAAKAVAREGYLHEMAIQEQAVSVASEAGRATGMLRHAQGPARQLRRAVGNISAGKIPGATTLDEQLKLIATLDDPAQVMKFARLGREASTLDKVTEVWINALLSGKALIVNPASNALVAAYTPLVRTVQAGISRVPVVGGGETVYFREGLAQVHGMMRSMRAASRDAWRIFLTEELPPHLASTKIEAPIQKAIGGRTGKAVRTFGRILQSQDAWFKLVNAGGEIEALAVRDALSKGLSGQAFKSHVARLAANTPKSIWNRAWRLADTNTFTMPLKEQTGLTSAVAKKIQGLAAEHPSVRFFFPFVRTPTNIFKYSVANSALAPLLKDVRREIAAGGAQRSQAMARIALGSSMGFAAWEMASQGIITGGGPSNPDRRRVWRMTHEPYSFRAPGTDTWINYGRLEPLGSILGSAADLHDLTSSLTDKERERGMGAAAVVTATMFARQAGNKTFINAATTLAKASDGEERYVDNLVQLLAGSVVPSGVAELARANDPVVRDTRGIVDRWQSRIPFASENLEPLMNLWGEPITRGDPVLNLFSPVYINPERKDRIATEMQRLGVSPQMPERQIAGVELTPKQYTRFVQEAGQNAKRMLDEQLNSREWAGKSDAAKIGIIETVISETKSMARRRLILENEEVKEAYRAKLRGE